GEQSAQAALRRSEGRFRLITEKTRDLVCLLDPRFHFIYASPSFQSVLGHCPRDLLDTGCFQLLHPQDMDLLKQTADEALFLRDGRTAEMRFRHASGSWQYFESAVSFIFSDSGQPQHALLVSRDTSERKRADREIRKLAAFPQFNPNPVLEFAAD